ncbi:hypothetical protein [Actinoplanes sp. NPDC048796]|uniref:hypothetical protein n=1 Tax=Actinoplanes sp. NPDC048796 TaxID=3155640 RepID=UPI0033C04D5A
MTGSDVPRGVRVITLLAWLMVPAGVLLVAAGVLDLTWWASGDAARLTAVITQTKIEYGINEPALLRNGDGAVTLIVLGTAGLTYGLLAPKIHRGQKWARSWALGIGFAIFLIGMLGVGADASQPSYLRDYYETLTWTTQTDRMAEIKALVYPAWYQWFEDFAQGLGAVAALAVVIGLSWSAVVHADYFVGARPGRSGAGSPKDRPDEWDAALARIRASGGIDAVHDDRAAGPALDAPDRGGPAGDGPFSGGPRDSGRDSGGPESGGPESGGPDAGAIAGLNDGRGSGGAAGGGGGWGGKGTSRYDDDIERLYRRPPRTNGDGTDAGKGD